MEYVLEAKSLCKEYRNFKALNGLNMSVPKGAIYGFVGKNGAGKTTLIRLICGLQEPSAGDVYKRQLLEETGITAGKMIYMGQFVPTCAYSSESIHMYLAKNLTFGDRKLDEDEFLNVSSVPLDDLVADILSGKIKDGKTQAAVLKAYLMLKGM